MESQTGMIKFQNKGFKIREIYLPEFGVVNISTISLNMSLLNKDGSYVSDKAIEIDEQILYFVEEHEIDFPNKELRNLIINQLC
jgi:hypothetical protein